MISSSQRPLPDKTQHSQQTNIYAPVGFEPTISAGERPQTYALDRAATGIGNKMQLYRLIYFSLLALRVSGDVFAHHHQEHLTVFTVSGSIHPGYCQLTKKNKLTYIVASCCRSQWQRGLRRRPTAARLLRPWVRIPPGAWMFVCCECCMLSSRGHCDELITRPEESYRLCCVVVCDLETSRMRRP